MNKNPIAKYAIINAVLTTLYVVLVSSFFNNAEAIFGDSEKIILIPIIMLLLLVFSAALTGALVFGRPVLWYMEGKKTEALKLLGYTLLVIFIVILLAMVVLYLLNPGTPPPSDVISNP